MFEPYQILGLAKSASIAEAKAAYRKLAMKYHPDRGGDEVLFKKIKGAWEAIDNGWTETIAAPRTPQYAPTQSSFTQQATAETARPTPRQNNWFRSRAHSAYAPFKSPPKTGSLVVKADSNGDGTFIARVSMAQAFDGFICEVLINGKTYQVNIPAGIPHGLRFSIPVEDDDVTVTTRFTQSAFQFLGIDTARCEIATVDSGSGLIYRTKDLRITIPVNSQKLRRGTKITFESFLGEKIDLAIPRDHDPRIPLKVEGKGYVDWVTSHSRAETKRGDIWVTIYPTEIPEPTVIR